MVLETQFIIYGPKDICNKIGIYFVCLNVITLQPAQTMGPLTLFLVLFESLWWDGMSWMLLVLQYFTNRKKEKVIDLRAI
jgi:hypothetical protein